MEIECHILGSVSHGTLSGGSIFFKSLCMCVCHMYVCHVDSVVVKSGKISAEFKTYRMKLPIPFPPLFFFPLPPNTSWCRLNVLSNNAITC